MPFDVIWKKLPGKREISRETYSTLEEAMESAKIVAIGGPGPVEITVVDGGGFQHHLAVVDNA